MHLLFKIIGRIAAIPFMPFHWLLGLIEKMAQGIWWCLRWPFDRGGAAELERQLARAGRERAREIDQHAFQDSETRRADFLARLSGRRNRRNTQQKQGHRRGR